MASTSTIPEATITPPTISEDVFEYSPSPENKTPSIKIDEPDAWSDQTDAPAPALESCTPADVLANLDTALSQGSPPPESVQPPACDQAGAGNKGRRRTHSNVSLSELDEKFQNLSPLAIHFDSGDERSDTEENKAPPPPDHPAHSHDSHGSPSQWRDEIV